MLRWRTMLATLALYAMSAGAASAQSALSCSAVPQSVCEDTELQAAESERAALVAQLSGAEPQNGLLAGEQTWIDGLSACGEDVACYRTAYSNHNQTLRESAAALPGGATTEPLIELPEEAPTVEEETLALDEAQAERLREPRESSADAYVATGAPGWGFFTAIGVTLFLFWLLLRARARYRREG
jgi:uncharacterized protein